MNHHSKFLVAVLMLVLACSCIASAEEPAVNNPFGVHTLMHDLSPQSIDKQFTWAKNLIGKGGYVKQIFMPILVDTPGARDDWKLFVQKCYDYDLIPIIRFAGTMEGEIWLKPQADAQYDYSTMAAAVKRVVSDLPRSEKYPLYIELWNEPNNHYEWSGKSDPLEYGHFFVQASQAIKSIGDPRIKVTIGALSPGGSYDNLKFIEVMCREVPGFIDAFDVWASHPYPIGPPEINRFEGNLPQTKWQFGIDGYRAELDVLAKYGRPGVKVMFPETGYLLGPGGEDELADNTLRVFRDYWTQWPEILAICPFTFSDPYGGFGKGDWVYPDSGTDENGLPTKAHGNYWAIYRLAKPTDPFGSISGKVTEDRFSTPVSGAVVVLSTGDETVTDGAGNYWFPRLDSGTYEVKVSKSGYSTESKGGITVSIGKNAVGNVEVSPRRMGTVRGVIMDSDTGLGLDRVMIELQPGEFRTLTDSQGRFVIENVPPSVYTLTAVKWGYYVVGSERLILEPGGSVAVKLYTAEGRPPMGRSLVGENSFENGGDGPAGGWTIWEKAVKAGALSVDRNVRYTGNASQKIKPDGSLRNHVWQMTDYSSIRPGREYKIEAWVRTENAVGEVKLTGGWFTNETVELGTFESEALTGTNGWTKLTATGIAPEFPEGKRGRLQVKMLANITSGTAWFDEVWAGQNW